MGRNAEARANLEESLAIAREFGDTRRIAVALQPLGLACLGQLDMAGARAHLQEALSMARELGNKREIAAALNTLAQLLRVVGERDAAKPLYEQSLALARELQDREYIAISLLNLTMVSIDSGANERAPSMLLDVLVVAEELGSKRIGQCALEVIAGLAASRKEWACAVRFYAMSEARAMQTGLHRDPADEAFLMPRIEHAREALAQADFSAAEAIGRAVTYEASISDARVWLEGISR
jgi:tetratricopeptide (TPR) repeat protein